MLKLKASYTTICADDLLKQVVSEYQIQNPTQCLFWSRGCHDIYEVRCEDGTRYSLRIYRSGVYPRDSVEFEMQALEHLHKQGFPVAYPVVRKTGGYVSEIAALEGNRFVILTTFAAGKEPDYDKPEDIRLMGESIAQMHKLSEGFKSTYQRPDIDLNTLLDESVEAIRPHVKHRAEDLAFLEKLAQESKDAVRAAPESALDTGFCHGDVHGYNAHIDNGHFTHFDFEECANGFRVFDLATFKWNATLNDQVTKQWQPFLVGYQSVRSISEADLAIVDTFVLIRHIWLIAFHMRNAGDFSHELTSEEYIDRQWKRLRKFAGLEPESAAPADDKPDAANAE